MTTTSTQALWLPSDWLLIQCIALSLITIVISVTSSGYFLNLNKTYRLFQFLMNNLNDKIIKIKTFIDAGCFHRKIDSQHLYEYLTELIRTLKRLSNLMRYLTNLIGNDEFRLRGENYNYQLDEAITELINLYNQLAEHLCHTPMTF